MVLLIRKIIGLLNPINLHCKNKLKENMKLISILSRDWLIWHWIKLWLIFILWSLKLTMQHWLLSGLFGFLTLGTLAIIAMNLFGWLWCTKNESSTWCHSWWLAAENEGSSEVFSGSLVAVDGGSSTSLEHGASLECDDSALGRGWMEPTFAYGKLNPTSHEYYGYLGSYYGYWGWKCLIFVKSSLSGFCSTATFETSC